MIYKDKCLELGLPEPKSYHNQETYVLMAISQGYKIHTYVARYIGIANLHSVVSTLKLKGHRFHMLKSVLTALKTKRYYLIPL